MPSSVFVAITFILLLSETHTEEMDSKSLSSAVAAFSLKFLNELDKSQSTVSSPLSAEFILALLALGASDVSHDELLSSLGFADDNLVRSSFSSVSARLKSIKGVTLNVANKVYIMEGNYDLQPQLKEDAVKVFDAAFEKVDFGSSSHAANLINTWVEDKTNKRIKNLISPDDLDSFSRLVLVNAIYFKGTWKKQFDPKNTMDRPFYLSATRTVELPMMYKEDTYKYGISEQLKAQILEIPYVGEEASMLIVLPDEIDGLNGLLEKLAGGYDLLAELDKIYPTKVQVTLPKFKIETEIDLNNLLPKIGVKSIFNQNNSGLTKILNTNEPLYVSKAIQKAFIEVNEEGAEAAAATAVAIVACMAFIGENPVHRVVADHPFLAVIVSNRTPYFLTTIRGF